MLDENIYPFPNFNFEKEVKAAIGIRSRTELDILH